MDGTDASEILIRQMSDYIGEKTKNGNVQYSNNKQPHDDFVSALYACFSTYVASEIPVGYAGLIGSI